MSSPALLSRAWLLALLLGLPITSAAVEPVGTTPLDWTGDLSARMVEGIDRFLLQQTSLEATNRGRFWNRDFSSPEAYAASVQTNRSRLRQRIGAVDPRLPVTALEYVSSTEIGAMIADTPGFRVFAVRWPVLEGVHGTGLLLQPLSPTSRALVVAIPDADQTPEMICGLAPGLPAEQQFARRLVENGCQVIVPLLINRQDTHSGNPRLNRFTNQPHREWVYRMGFELGRHIIGYEVQKVLAAVDWLSHEQGRRARPGGTPPRIGVVGYGEGGLIALYAAAIDTRIDAAWVSGYFRPREGLWEEPIYRNVFGLLEEFGDAEIASLVAPRALIVEYSEEPRVAGPPARREGRGGAAPGRLATPERFRVEAEVERARALLPQGFSFPLRWIEGNEGVTLGPGSDAALIPFLAAVGSTNAVVAPGAEAPRDRRPAFDPEARHREQLDELVRHCQQLLLVSDDARADFLWRRVPPRSTNAWVEAMATYKTRFWNDVIGRLPPASLPAQPRARKILTQPKWTAYEVVLDVWPEVFGWGILVLPNDLQPGERRPVVVCQHGLEGVPLDTLTDDTKTFAHGAYQAFTARLAERGFITFAPHNPYRGEDRFRVLQRKANPLGKSLFSVILAQHERILDWLGSQPFVDPARIAFYGLSYGGKTAMRVPALLDRYCLSICSADFNDWVKKIATTESPYSYLYTGEYELQEWDLGHTFNYAEMAGLIAPRPFMVERGHDDGVAPDEWVAYEYARVRRLYAKLGLAGRTEIEFFNGPHTIHGVGTFRFLHQHLNWPEPK